MNGIGQEMQVIMPDLQDALMQHSAKQRQFDAANQLAQGGNGWGGIGEILGAALGAYKSNKFGGELDKSQSDINTQIAQFQEQKAQELAQMEQAKAQAEIERKRQDAENERKAKLADALALKQFDVDNRVPQQSKPSATQELLSLMSPDQRAAYLNKQAGIQQQGAQMFTPQEIAFMEQNPDKAPALRQKKENDMLGVAPESQGERKKAAAQDALRSSMENLYNQVSENGTEWGGKKGAKMETAYGDFFMKYKNAEELGAIQGADERLVKNILADPTSFWGQLNPMRGGNIKAQMEEYAKLQGWNDFGQGGGAEQAQPQLPQSAPQGNQLNMQNVQSVVDLYNKKGGQ